MGTIAEKLSKLLQTKNAIKAAIIGKGQTVTDTDPFSSYPEKIAAIETGIDTSDATAAAGDILADKTAYVDGQKVTGIIPSKSLTDLTASGATVSVPAGYYPAAVSKSVATASRAAPSITKSSTGLITATVTQAAGYVTAGTATATYQLPTKAATTYTPGISNQTIASGYYLTGTQTIEGDANLVASNIKSGVSIFGVAGSLQDTRNESLTDISVSGKYLYINTDYPIDQLLDFVVVVGDDSYMQYFELEPGSDTDVVSIWLADSNLSSPTSLSVSYSDNLVTVWGVPVFNVSSADFLCGRICYIPSM